MSEPATRTAAASPPESRRSWGYVLLFLFVLYWLLARELERIDLSQSPPGLWQAYVAVFPLLDLLTPFLLPIFELFAPRVLRHLIPVLVGAWLARQAAIELAQKLYDLPDGKVAAAMLGRLRSGQSPPGKSAVAQRKGFAEHRHQEPLLRVGGPGFVVVENSDVIVTERNGRFHRALAAGKHRLFRFESVRAVLDLRPHERKVDQVPLMTKDGIELFIPLSLTYAIDSGDQTPTQARPYPYDERAVRLAAYAEVVGEGQTISTWETQAVTVTTGQLKAAVARFRLDELVYPRRATADPYQAVKSEMDRRAREVAARFGVRIIETQIGRFELPEPVKSQNLDVWDVQWERVRRVKEAGGKVEARELTEQAKAQGEAAIIQAIIEGVQRARQEGASGSAREVVALRVVEALEKVAEGSHALPLDTLNRVLSQLGELRQKVAPVIVSEQATVIYHDKPDEAGPPDAGPTGGQK